MDLSFNEPGADCLSVREPQGRVYRVNQRILRGLYPKTASLTLEILKSSAIQELIREKKCIDWWELEEGEAPVSSQISQADEFTWIEHPKVFFSSYPYEWSPGMLQAAGVLTLEIAERILQDGLGLKDATPYNILFEGPRPIHVDLLSCEERESGNPIWAPFSQFLQSFYFPLWLSSRRGGGIQRWMGTDAVVDAEFLHRWLPFRSKLSFAYFSYIFLPRLLSGKKRPDSAIYEAALKYSPERAKFTLGHTLSTLKRRMLKFQFSEKSAGEWSSYGANPESYEKEQYLQKQKWVSGILAKTAPQRVLDIGANTGTFSALAAKHGAQVLSIDSDPICIDRLWSKAQSENLNILPLVVDFARPSAGLGWENKEQIPFLARAKQADFDMIFMLAVIHHLVVGQQIPLSYVLELVHGLTSKHLLLEWVGPKDPMVSQIARGRKTGIYSDEEFELAATKFFEIDARESLQGTDRKLYLLRKRGA